MKSILLLLIAAETKFRRAPGAEHADESLFPGEKSLTIVVEGTYELLTSGFVTLLLLPVLAVILYRTGYRVAGPLLALFTLGLFLAQMFGAPA
ncbi:MAG TPA: hypothetical protein VMY41_04865 [Thermohalobaculum sp.]|nr:hypothetical protein [Thermohalobaculum sp.]